MTIGAIVLSVLVIPPVLLIAWIKADTVRARNFWLRYLIEHGPTRYSRIPRFSRRMLPIEQYRREGFVELDDGLDPMVQASGLAREFMLRSTQP